MTSSLITSLLDRKDPLLSEDDQNLHSKLDFTPTLKEDESTISLKSKTFNEDNDKEFNPSKMSPMFHGYKWYKNLEYCELLDELEANEDYSSYVTRIREDAKAGFNPEIGGDFDPCLTHPACWGYQLLAEAIPNTKSLFETVPSPKTCSAREYLDTYIFPILLPAMEGMLKEAKIQDAFMRRRTKFNGCDYLTEYLYRHNPAFMDRQDISLMEIPFVQRILEENPRAPIPLSLLITEDEAATMIQSFWRGYQIRKDPEVQELRKYQKEMREEEYDINFRVSEFWKKHPVEDVDKEFISGNNKLLTAEDNRETLITTISIESEEVP